MGERERGSKGRSIVKHDGIREAEINAEET